MLSVYYFCTFSYVSNVGEKVWWAWGALLKKQSTVHGIYSLKVNPGFLVYGSSGIMVFLQPTDNI